MLGKAMKATKLKLKKMVPWMRKKPRESSSMKKEGLKLLEATTKMLTYQAQKAKEKFLVLAIQKLSELPAPVIINDMKNTFYETLKPFHAGFSQSVDTKDIQLAPVCTLCPTPHTLLFGGHQTRNNYGGSTSPREGPPHDRKSSLRRYKSLYDWNPASHSQHNEEGDASRFLRCDRFSGRVTYWRSNKERSFDFQRNFVDLREEAQRLPVKAISTRLSPIAEKHYKRLLRLRQDVRDEQVVKRKKNPSLPPGPPSLRPCVPHDILPNREAPKLFRTKKEVRNLVKNKIKRWNERWEERRGSERVPMMENEPKRFRTLASHAQNTNRSLEERNLVQIKVDRWNERWGEPRGSEHVPTMEKEPERFRFYASHALNTNRSLEESRALFYLTGSDNPRKRKMKHLMIDED